MEIRITRILTSDEFLALTEDAVAKGFYRDDPRILRPGMAWYMDWIYDPSGEREKNGKIVMIKASRKGNHPHLSDFYWNDWSDVRPPLCIVCPNGELWEVDRKITEPPFGWQVTGPFPNITCSSSIVAPGYHGFLKDGVFTRDLEGRGRYGISREQRTPTA